MEGLSLTSERFDRLAYRVGSSCAVAGNFRKSIDSDHLSVAAVLSFPTVDLQGDVVHVEPRDFAEHELRGGPVDLEHSRTPEFGNLNIAKSMHPDGKYAVEFRTLTLDDGKTKIRLPVGTSYFDKSSRRSMQVFSMIEKGMLPGVSLEFKAISGRPLGPSPLENRQAYEFDRVSVVKYCHCAEPVCPAAMLTVGKAVPTNPSLDLLVPVIQTGKLGSEVLDPMIRGVLRKSIERYTPKRVLVTSGFEVSKAMDDYNANPDTVYGDADDQPDTMEDMPGAAGPPTATAAYTASQSIKDCIEQAKTTLQSSEHVKGKAKILKILDKIEQTAIAQLIAVGDEVTDEVSGNEPMSDDEPDTNDLEDDATDEDEDDDGLMKAFKNPDRQWVRKAIIARRVAKSRVDVARRPAPAPEIEPEIPAVDPDLAAALEERERECALFLRDHKRFG